MGIDAAAQRSRESGVTAAHDGPLRRYAALRGSAVARALPALLDLGAQASTIVFAPPQQAVQVFVLGLGHAGTPATLFRDVLPTALELENAIAVVEDAVMPFVGKLRGATELAIAGRQARDVLASAAPGAGLLTLEQVEALFGDLAAAVTGGPVTRLPFASTKAAAAALLIVRELMHHCGIASLRLLP